MVFMIKIFSNNLQFIIIFMIKIFSAAALHCAAMPVMKPKLRSNSLLFIEFEDDFVRCHFALRARKSFTTFIKIVGNFKKKIEIVLTLKVAFLQKVWFVFQISKKIFRITILSLKFKFPTNNCKVFWAGNLNFKFRKVFWNVLFGDLEIWKMNRTFWKKSHL